MQFFSYNDTTVTAAPTRATLRPVLREFSDDELDSLDKFVAELRFATGSQIIASGECNDSLFIVVSGSVAIAAGEAGSGEECHLQEGEVFGISSFLDGEASTLAATALEPSEVLVLRRESFAQLAAWKPVLAIRLLSDLAAYTSRRLRQLQIIC